MTFWKQARGDHIMTAAIVMSFIFSYTVAQIILAPFPGSYKAVFFFFSSMAGVLIPLYIIPVNWVNNELPKGHFWRDLLS